MDEPSVLDFIIDKLIFWKKSKVAMPPAEDKEESPEVDLPREKKSGSIWQGILILIPTLLAIVAQVFCEPEYRSQALVIFFYAGAIGALLIWIFLKNWKISSLQSDEGEADQFSVRWILLLVGSLFSGLAFLFFLGNLFTAINLVLWIIGFGLIWGSVWVPGDWWGKLKTTLKGFFENGIQITPWFLLVLGVFALAGFYRFYQLNQVPPEMFSDHAEKLIDVSDVLKGHYHIFFPRNTGREAIQMYLTAAVSRVFGTGISFLSLKLGTGLAGLFMLPFIYLLGKEIKNKEVGLLAMFFAGIAYWPNVISRVALRFTFYPTFVAPLLYFLVRGIKNKRWNDFLFAGIALGLGLHGYSTFRIVPLVVIATLVIYMFHTSSNNNRRQAIIALILVGLISLVIFLPLLRYAQTNYDMFTYRMRSRLTDSEHPLPGDGISIFLSNIWKSLFMFQWDNGQIWVHSIPGRPALGVISAALFSLGVVILLVRYLRNRHWMDLATLLWIPLLMLPSILSIAFPDENPSLNRSGGAIIPVFLVIGFGVENLIENIRSRLPGQRGKWFSWIVVLLLAAGSLRINFNLVFKDYYDQFKMKAWNTSEIGSMVRGFSETIGDQDHVWVIPYPYWVDTRLVGIQGVGWVRDYALWQEDIPATIEDSPPKLYIYKADDQDTADILQDLYPEGIIKRYNSEVEGRDFMLYYVLQ
jgi:hypothetical protein